MAAWDELTNDPIRGALDRLEAAMAERDRHKLDDVPRQRALARVGNDRDARTDELLAEAGRVLAWRDEFLRTRDARRIWELLGDDVRLPIFVAAYWDGQPSPRSDVCTAVVLTGSLHQFRLEGWGMGERRTRSPRLAQPGEIVRAFNPDMLVEFRLHLESRAHEQVIAEYVEQELGRYVIAPLHRSA